MILRQQPVQARMCGVGDKCELRASCLRGTTDTSADRRPIDPTPIVQLKVIEGDDGGDGLGKSAKALRKPEGASGMSFLHSES